jgi:ATP-dependent RNA helicase RhlE
MDIVVACPGRLIDLIGQGHVKLDAVEILVLDEADRMLDMGFLPDIRRIMALMPRERQTLLFSATMPGEIRTLARGIMRDPVEVAVAPVSSSAETVTQGVFHVTRPQKQPLLTKLLGDPEVERTLVFTRTKHGADKVVRKLAQSHIRAEAIHGNKSQNARQRALDGFRNGTLSVLVASDIAARGLDVDGISHVINFDVPNEPETYVHRIGRTGRAGKSGTAWSLCDGEERSFLADIERTIRRRLDVLPLPPLPQLPPDPMPTHFQRAPQRGGGGRGHGGHGGGHHAHQPGLDTRHDGHGQPQRRDHQGHGHGQRRSNPGARRGGRPSQW